MSKVYIAAKYARRQELQAVAAAIKAHGHEVVCRWVTEGEEKKTAAEAAMMDVDDVFTCDTIIFIGERSGSKNTGGGRWFEFGLAYSLGKRMIAVLHPEPAESPRSDVIAPFHESVFTSLTAVECFFSIEEAIRAL